MATTTTSSVIERADIHKSCKSLESVTSLLVNYIETLNSLISINKKLAKALRDTASVKGTNGIPANALSTSAYIFEAIFEVDAKFTKIADKEVDALTGDIKKWFKKLAKEEKAHDERLANASAKLKQAGQTYEKKAKRKDADLSEEHTRYLAVLNTVGPEMTQDKQNHALYMTQRHTTLVSNVAATISRLAETEWGRACEYVRKFAPFIGGIGECRALCEGGWNGDLPPDLPDEPSDLISNTVSMDNETIRARTGRSNTPLQPTMAPTATTISTTSATAPATAVTANPSPRSNTRSRSNTFQAADDVPEHEISTSQSSEVSLLSVPEPDNSKQPFEPSSPVDTAHAADSYNSGVLRRSPSPLRPSSSHNRVSKAIMEEEEQLGQPAEKLESHNTQSQAFDSTSTAFPNPSSDLAALKVDDPPMLVSTTKPTLEPTKEATLASKPSRPLPLPSPRGIRQIDLDRMQSTDSLTSRVAAMRERYDTRTMHDTPPSPSPRDLPVPRTTQRVADIANRYTSPPPRSDGSLPGQAGLSLNDHFPTFQERFGRGQKLKVMDKPPPDSYKEEMEPEPYDAYEDEVFRYSGVTLQDRDRIVGGGKGGYPRAESTYYDELGVRTRGGKALSGTIDVLELRAREAQLVEQERRLDLERARLLTARDSVVADAAVPYNRRYSESPQPLKALHPFETHGQGMPSPEEHPLNCNCQRCSQFYAPGLQSYQRSIPSTQDPPSPLRPGMDNNKQWRRLSTSFVPPERNLGMSGRNISSPSIVHMSLPPEDLSRNGRRRSFDIMNDRDVFSGNRRVFTQR
ncbi:hypothetical protein Clacol_002522 [Clathrus columnatus]|uniref:Uncharacterized protein n=1 Tax=Clathrus columnatus TaxID=1419009 RepID=A0AAV5A0Z1_9AGAM|nr:hypothetical protein Clacol_002522 [Clathrus columnatus]